MMLIFACLVTVVAAQGPQWNGTSGFIPVKSTLQDGPDVVGDMFYWFFPPRNGDATAPMMIWLQGGPGSSGIEEGLLKLNGPYAVFLSADGDLQLIPREITWNEEFAMLYVDSPVGTGYSYQTGGSYASTEESIATMLIQTLEGVYAKSLWPSVNGLYITGESYGGHYCPALAAAILRKKLSPESTPIMLKGVAIGDGLTDPATQVVTKPNAAYYMGLIDEKTRDQAQSLADQAAAYANSGDYVDAVTYRSRMENLVLDTSQINGYDVRTFDQYDDSVITNFLNNETTKAALNVPANISFGTNVMVSRQLQDDIMRSYKAEVETVLGMGVPVLLYQGQMDWKDGCTSNDAWIASMYPDTEFGTRQVLGVTTTRELRNPRGILPISSITTTEPYGWIRQLNTEETAGYSGIILYDVVIAAAGHLVPFDQPLAAKDMITRFIRGNLTTTGRLRYPSQEDPTDPPPEETSLLRGAVPDH